MIRVVLPKSLQDITHLRNNFTIEAKIYNIQSKNELLCNWQKSFFGFENHSLKNITSLEAFLTVLKYDLFQKINTKNML